MNIVRATSRSHGSRANYVSSHSHISGLFPFLRLHLAPSQSYTWGSPMHVSCSWPSRSSQSHSIMIQRSDCLTWTMQINFEMTEVKVSPSVHGVLGMQVLNILLTWAVIFSGNRFYQGLFQSVTTVPHGWFKSLLYSPKFIQITDGTGRTTIGTSRWPSVPT